MMIRESIKRAVPLFTLALIGSVAVGIMLAIDAASTDPVDKLIASKMREKAIPGLALAVIRDGRVIKEKAYGYANLELKVPITVETSFPWASTTKAFTAVAIMQLVEKGEIALDRSVNSIIPGLPSGWSKVTVRHCLAHTTGLPYAV